MALASRAEEKHINKYIESIKKKSNPIVSKQDIETLKKQMESEKQFLTEDEIKAKFKL